MIFEFVHKLFYEPFIPVAVPCLLEKRVFISQSVKRGRALPEFFKTALAEVDPAVAGQIFSTTLAKDRKYQV